MNANLAKNILAISMSIAVGSAVFVVVNKAL